MQRLLWRGPAGAACTLCGGGPGGPPTDTAPCPVQSCGPTAGHGGTLQYPAVPHQVSSGTGRGPVMGEIGQPDGPSTGLSESANRITSCSRAPAWPL